MMKKILNIKWENIISIMFGSFFIYAITYHQVINGFDLINLFYELMIYGLVTFMTNYGIKSIRNEYKSK